MEPTNYPIHATMAVAWNYAPSVSLQMLSKQTDGPVGGSFCPYLTNSAKKTNPDWRGKRKREERHQ